MMDETTLKHLLNWIDKQFGSDQFELFAAMSEQYRTDPELYDCAGWWRCHDDMVRNGNTTL